MLEQYYGLDTEDAKDSFLHVDHTFVVGLFLFWWGDESQSLCAKIFMHNSTSVVINLTDKKEIFRTTLVCDRRILKQNDFHKGKPDFSISTQQKHEESGRRSKPKIPLADENKV